MFRETKMNLRVLAITINCPNVHQNGYDKKCQRLMSHTTKIAATDEDGTNGIDKIVHRVDETVGVQIDAEPLATSIMCCETMLER